MSRRSTRPLPGTQSYELVETGTRDAIKCAGRTIAYVAVGAEDHGAMLAASCHLYKALRAVVLAEFGSLDHPQIKASGLWADAAKALAEVAT